MAELTIEVPDDLAMQLKPMQDRLIEIIELGLRDIQQTHYGLYQEVVEFLASSPSPGAMLAFHPSPEAQARVAELLDKNKTGILSSEEQAELDHYEHLDFMMTLVKAQARK